jgi:hypothetical protein
LVISEKKGMDVSKTELATFQVLSNLEYVDWSRASKLQEPKIEIEELEEEEDSMPPPSPRKSTSPLKLEEEKVSRSRSRTPSPPPAQPLRPASRPHSASTYGSSHNSSPKKYTHAPLPRSVSPPPLFSPAEPKSAFVPPPMPHRPMPKPRKYTAQEENEDYEVLAEKEALLQELHNLEKTLGVKLTRQWDVDKNTLDELQFEFDRIQSEQQATQVVDYAKTGIKFGVAGIEFALKKAGLESVDGWYNNSCKDMNKYNRPLGRLYKKYWRKTQMSPITELGFLLVGSLGWTVVQNKLGMKGGGLGSLGSMFGATATANAASSSSSSGTNPSAFEPPPRPPATPGGQQMRPPGSNPSFKGPSWTSASIPTPTTTSSSDPQPVKPAAVPVPTTAPATSTDSSLALILQQLVTQNEKIVGLLETKESKPATPPFTTKIKSLARSDSESSSYSHKSVNKFKNPPQSMVVPLKKVGTATARKRAAAEVLQF